MKELNYISLTTGVLGLFVHPVYVLLIKIMCATDCTQSQHNESKTSNL